MKSPILLLIAIPLVALSSCSSVKQTVAKVGGSTAKTFRAAKSSTSKTLTAAKEKTFGAREPKLRLTKADPKRFLPQGTSAEKVRVKNAPSQPSKKQTRLLAKHTKAKTGPRPSQTKSKAIAQLPPLELPPLPQATEDDNGEFRGILPSLDGSDTATFIDVNGKTPELPPMEIPDFEFEDEDESETSA